MRADRRSAGTEEALSAVTGDDGERAVVNGWGLGLFSRTRGGAGRLGFCDAPDWPRYPAYAVVCLLLDVLIVSGPAQRQAPHTRVR